MTEYIIGVVVVLLLVVIGYVLWKKREAAPPSAPASTTDVAVSGGIAPPASEAPAWTREEAMNYVWGQVAPGMPSQDGNVKFLGIAGSAAECESSCGGNKWCHGYTWHDASNGSYSKMCYGVGKVGMKVPEPHHSSGQRAEGFSSTLMHRMGMESAGKEHFRSNSTVGTFDSYKQNFRSNPVVGTFDSYKQNFTSIPNVAKNTMWSGYQHSSVLPL